MYCHQLDRASSWLSNVKVRSLWIFVLKMSHTGISSPLILEPSRLFPKEQNGMKEEVENSPFFFFMWTGWFETSCNSFISKACEVIILSLSPSPKTLIFKDQFKLFWKPLRLKKEPFLWIVDKSTSTSAFYNKYLFSIFLRFFLWIVYRV